MSVYFAVVYEESGYGYHANFPDLPGCVTQGRTLEELDVMLRDALFVYIDGCRELGDAIPAPGTFDSVASRVDKDAFAILPVAVVECP